MAILSLPYFGFLDPESLETYYEMEVPFNGKQIQIDLNFEHGNIDIKRLETVKSFIENIRIYDLNNKGYINNDYNDEDADTVREYIEHHLNELGKLELAALTEQGSKPVDYEKQLLKKLHLIRVGIYPDSEAQFAIFDYSLGTEFTNYLVVINTDENGNLDYMTMES